jgi:hypothetical protein
MAYVQQQVFSIEDVNRELQRISDAIETFEADGVRLYSSNIEPDKPREGDIRFADGVNWNAGSGIGPYIYYESRWHSMSNGNFMLEVAKGNIAGHSFVNKFGRNADVDTGANENIWDGGGLYSWPTTAQVHDLVSTSVNDASAGTGARTVQVYGLDSTYTEITETVTMNGTTNVATSNSYLRIYRMVVKSAGSLGLNEGIISATGQTDATVSAQISATYNQTLMAIYTVPLNKTGYIYSFFASMNRNTTSGAMDILFCARPDGEVMQVKAHSGGVGSGTSHYHHNYHVPLKFEAKTDLIMVSSVSANNTDVSGGFDLLLVED